MSIDNLVDLCDTQRAGKEIAKRPFNKAYSTDVNKCMHCVRADQFTTVPRHTRDDCKLGGGEPCLACCVCDNNQQAINTRAAPRFLLQPMLYSQAVSALMKAIAVTGQIAGFTGPGSGPG